MDTSTLTYDAVDTAYSILYSFHEELTRKEDGAHYSPWTPMERRRLQDWVYEQLLDLSETLIHL